MSSFCFGAPYHRNLEFPAGTPHISMQVVVLQYKRDSFKKTLISGVSDRHISSTFSSVEIISWRVVFLKQLCMRRFSMPTRLMLVR